MGGVKGDKAYDVLSQDHPSKEGEQDAATLKTFTALDEKSFAEYEAFGVAVKTSAIEDGLVL